jgi:hypothetical protein
VTTAAPASPYRTPPPPEPPPPWWRVALLHWRTGAAALTALALFEAQVAWGPPWLFQAARVVAALGMAAGFLLAADARRVEALAQAANLAPYKPEPFGDEIGGGS